MAALKFALCLVCAVVAVQAEDLSSRPVTKFVTVEAEMKPKEPKASIVSSNLPLSDQYELASEIQNIFNSISNPVNRAIAVSNTLDRKYPYTRNNAVIQYLAIAYYQKYYLQLVVNGQDVLCFGL